MPRIRNLKKTVNLPRTSFPMKANLPKQEPGWLDFWEQIDLYGQLRAQRAGAPLFILHDGPPYANAQIHLGQALNKILKDMVVRSRSMAGMDAPFVPGWDCHGLPIEHRVDRELKKKKKHLSPLQIRRLCRKYAEKYIHLQRQAFRRLGVLWDWKTDLQEEQQRAPSRRSIYRTLDHDYESAIVREMGRFFASDSIYYGKKPVHWCPSCQTALAEAEVEYAPRTDEAVYVAFPLRTTGLHLKVLQGMDVRAVIWTTTPWTLPANRALCFHPDLVYTLVRVKGNVYVVARELLQATARACGWEEPKTVAVFTGRELAPPPDPAGSPNDSLPAAEPPYMKETGGPLSRLIQGDHVTLEQGTGIVHTAPGHGADDFYVSARYGIEPWVPVDGEGRFIHKMIPSLGGVSVFEANGAIIADLEKRGWLLSSEPYRHDYPHCWRCRGPIVFRATPQWFISMDKNGLRDRALKAIHRTTWRPAFGETRIAGMIQGRPDWCISRQRTWGVPIPVFQCTACSVEDELIHVKDPRFFEHLAHLYAETGSDAWFGTAGSDGETVAYRDEAEARARLLPPNLTCPRCRRVDHLERRFEIVDVWFESGASHAAVLRREGLRWPADLYLEGHDQYRGWFHSSLLIAVEGHDGAPPYKGVITHGFTLDGGGRKMSKSLGNSVSPIDLAETRGADTLRLWVSMVNHLEDMRISEESLARYGEAYRKIRNTFRYILGNLSDFAPDRDALPVPDLEDVDRYILDRFDHVRQTILKAYETHEFHPVAHSLHRFCGVDLSSFYLDVIKDRLYTFAPHSRARRSAQTALWILGMGLCRLMAPVLCFTAEEVWQQIPGGIDSHPSVHLAL
ncbi:MAG: isoleucine--tRNA ligase, partial [Acidobacteriota bacterium]